MSCPDWTIAPTSFFSSVDARRIPLICFFFIDPAIQPCRFTAFNVRVCALLRFPTDHVLLHPFPGLFQTCPSCSPVLVPPYCPLESIKISYVGRPVILRLFFCPQEIDLFPGQPPPSSPVHFFDPRCRHFSFFSRCLTPFLHFGWRPCLA